MRESTPAQSAYDSAVATLRDFCDKYTDLIPNIVDDHYPIVIQFIPDQQMSIFGNRNINENGEVKELTVAVGLNTTVISTLDFNLDAKLFKKLIKVAETVGELYYHAFREGARSEMSERLIATPTINPNDLRPRGRWVETNWAERDGHGEVITHYEITALKCSNCCCCFKKESLWRRNYCPNCGAKMDGKENEDA